MAVDDLDMGVIAVERPVGSEGDNLIASKLERSASLRIVAGIAVGQCGRGGSPLARGGAVAARGDVARAAETVPAQHAGYPILGIHARAQARVVGRAADLATGPSQPDDRRSPTGGRHATEG